MQRAPLQCPDTWHRCPAVCARDVRAYTAHCIRTRYGYSASSKQDKSPTLRTHPRVDCRERGACSIGEAPLGMASDHSRRAGKIISEGRRAPLGVQSRVGECLLTPHSKPRGREQTIWKRAAWVRPQPCLIFEEGED